MKKKVCVLLYMVDSFANMVHNFFPAMHGGMVTFEKLKSAVRVVGFACSICGTRFEK